MSESYFRCKTCGCVELQDKGGHPIFGIDHAPDMEPVDVVPAGTVAKLRELALSLCVEQPHYYCEDSWYSCPKAQDGCANDAAGTGCNCGAEKWNAKVVAARAALAATEAKS